MPNTKSAKKRVKIIEKRTLRNKMIKSSMKTAIKKLEAAISEGNLERAKELYPQVVKKIDMAAAKGVIHKNTANRKKSRLALKLNAVEKMQIAQ